MTRWRERKKANTRYLFKLTVIPPPSSVRLPACLQASQAQAQAESTNRLKSKFLASMSHELRNLINGIMGYAEYIREVSSDTLLRLDNSTGAGKWISRQFTGVMEMDARQ